MNGLKFVKLIIILFTFSLFSFPCKSPLAMISSGAV